jgi:hypothetical protein
MSTLRHPVGRQPASVYWRRRLVLGIGLLVVVVVILLIVFAPKGGTPAADPSKSSHPAASSNTPNPASTKAPACDKGDLTVTASVDQKSYSAESQPQLSFTITNDSASACTVSAGSDKQVFQITSGKEVYWTSTDCQTDAQKYSKVMQPGDELSPSNPVGWDRTRSSKSTCEDNRAPVPAGGATYHLTVTVDGVKSTNNTPFILN